MNHDPPDEDLSNFSGEETGNVFPEEELHHNSPYNTNKQAEKDEWNEENTEP